MVHGVYFRLTILCWPSRFTDRSVTMEKRLGALRLYRQHLVAQYADRCAFWSLKDISMDMMAQTVAIITDGADQVHCFSFNVCEVRAIS